MDMDKNTLKTFCKYQQTVLFEELEFQKFSETGKFSKVNI